MSGYQESLVRVGSLAEAAGILAAFEGFSWPHFWAFGVERAVRDTSPEARSDLGELLRLPRIGFKRGDLFVILCGDRHPYQFCSGRWRYIDGLPEEVRESYGSFLVKVGDAEVQAAWDEDPATARRARRAWKDYLGRVWEFHDAGEGDPRERFAEVVYGPDADPPTVMTPDPDPVYAIAEMFRERGLPEPLLNQTIFLGEGS